MRRAASDECATFVSSPSPREVRGEGWGEGLLPQIPKTKYAVSPPHPETSSPTSPRKRGEVRAVLTGYIGNRIDRRHS